MTNVTGLAASLAGDGFGLLALVCFRGGYAGAATLAGKATISARVAESSGTIRSRR